MIKFFIASYNYNYNFIYMKKFREQLIAPCGMNCALCSGYLAFKNDLKSKGINHHYCKGCRAENKQCAGIKKRCEKLNKDEIEFCFVCNDYPCSNINRIDVRYKKFYRMSEIENLNFIKIFGVKKFIKQQEKTWKCKNCGELICCHNGICYSCQSDKLKARKNRLRWEEN